MNTQEMIETIKTQIEDLQSDIKNELFTEDETMDRQLDMESLKTVLGHLLTLKTC